jgi:hypothetical protein
MGMRATSIFSDDTAFYVRADFLEHIGNALSADEATRQVLASYGMETRGEPDDLEHVMFWLGLAATQWRCGRLLDAVKDRALRVIDAGADLELWTDSATPREIAKRREVLGELRLQLLSPQPRAKKIKKVTRERSEWEVGHALSYRLSSGQFIVLRVIDVFIDERRFRSPVLDVCDWIGASPPDGEAIVALPRRHTKFLQYELRMVETMTHADPTFLERGIERLNENDGKMVVFRYGRRA